MKYFISIFIILAFFTLNILFYRLYQENLKNENLISAYYNSSGSFAGFIQTENGLIRACEFSTNGTILSCSKWFKKESLTQGQNKGLTLEDI